MGQEISVSLQAVKTKVYKLIDALIEGAKTEAEVQESIRRWWKLIHPADRAVASENCMMPFGPAGLTASGWPQLSRYAMAAITDAGMPVRAEALRKSFASRAPVIRSAPDVARGSRMMAKVCPWIIRAVRVASTVGEISVRSTPIPDNRCSGVKYSGRARSKGVQTSAVNTEVRREICTKRHSNVAHILLEYVRYG